MYIKDLWLVGIGTGSRQHLTYEGEAAIRGAAVILIPRKGDHTSDLFDLRCGILKTIGFDGMVQTFDYPSRDPNLPYIQQVTKWHHEIARRWQTAASKVSSEGPVGLLVWGDPTLYDSTIRIAHNLDPPPRVKVIPGITAIQALTSAHGIPLNTIAGSVKITTGRRLRQEGWPHNIETVVVMLDNKTSFKTLNEPDLEIWWGAYLGTADQLLMHGPLPETGECIEQRRREAQKQKGWIMDTYLIRKTRSA